MNPKRLVLAIVAVFIGIAVTDFLIHQVWLKEMYGATASLWRTEGDMQAHLGWIMVGEFLVAVTFTTLWARGFAEHACPTCATMFGLFMGLFSQAHARSRCRVLRPASAAFARVGRELAIIS